MKYAVGAALAAFIFAGCGDDDVGLVKNYTLPDFKSMNIGDRGFKNLQKYHLEQRGKRRIKDG